MPVSKPTWWEGVLHTSLGAAARARNRSLTAMKYCADRGYTCEADLYHGRHITIDDVEYKSIMEAARQRGEHPRTMMQNYDKEQMK